MIFHPSILALLAGSVLVGFMILYSASHAVRILKNWNLDSGSELQLTLERKTYLISTLLSYVFAFELLSFFLYISAAERLHVFFVGAMCAAGSLYADSYGYPALIFKLFNFFIAGIWLIINYVDNLGYDYPLIKKKYALLLFFSPFAIFEIYFQAKYFFDLKPNIITSCCGTLFSSGSYLSMPEIRFIENIPIRMIFFIVLLLTISAGFYYYATKKCGYFFSVMSALAFFVSVVSIFSFISCYIYELPEHHCPFCMLQEEYGYIGYPIYATLFGGAIFGVSVGVLAPFGGLMSLSGKLLPVQRRLALASAMLFLAFTVIVSLRIYYSGLVMEG